MRTAKEVAEAMKAVEAQIDALLAKDEAGENDETLLVDLDEKAAQLNAELETVNARDAIASRSAARKATLSKPVNQPAKPVKADVEQAVTSNVHHRVEDDPQGGYARYEDFCSAVVSASTPGGMVDENLLILNAAYGQTGESGADGAFLTPPEYSNRIVERVHGVLPLVSMCDQLTLQGSSVTVNGMSDHDRSGTTYRHGGVVAYWVGEGDQITRSSLKFRQINLRLKKLAALSFVTEEEMQDVVNFGGRLLDKQGAAIADELVESIMFGTGAGQPLGAFTGTSPCVQVAKETGQDADTIVAENIINMNSVIYSPSRATGHWYYNGECLPQLETMSISVGTGGVPAFWPAGGLSGTSPAMIKGRPAHETDHCEALGDAGDVVFADWGQYLLAMKGTVDTAMSIHLRFDYAETAFRSIFRVDGRPAWDSNLKPRKGASARRVSPFVKLAARA